MVFMSTLIKFFTPEIFQGEGASAPYFEGWYFKAAAPDGAVFSVIPGISLCGEQSHAFIQYLDSHGKSGYFRYALNKFRYAADSFYLSVGGNVFTEKGFVLNIQKEINLHGRVEFRDRTGYPKSFLCPGIMGPFSYIPAMKCRHHVITTDCTVQGTLEIDGEKLILNGGKGYAEKDWGSSFPETYVWAQSNQFSGQDASFMISAADVPVHGRSITGVIGFLRTGRRFLRFATYLGAKLCTAGHTGHETVLRTTMRSYTLTVSLHGEKMISLKAPESGKMSREVAECPDGTVEVALEKSGKRIFTGTGHSAGIEICGDIRALTRNGDPALRGVDGNLKNM